MVGSLLNDMNDPFARHEVGQNSLDFTKFDGAEAFNTFGFQEASGAVNGRAGTQEIDQEKLEQAERREENRKRDIETTELIELGYQLREARVSAVFDGLSEEALDFAVQETLENIDDVAERHNLNDQEKAQLESWLVAYQTASPKEQEQILDKIAEQYPGVAADMAKTAETYDLKRSPDNISTQELEDAEQSAIRDDAEFRVVVSMEATAEEAEGIVAMREGASLASSDFMSSLAAGVSASAEFNAQAAGSLAAIDAEPVVVAPAATAPALA